MRDILVVLGVCLAAVAAGAWLFWYGPQQFEKVDGGAQATEAAPSPSEAAAAPSSVPSAVPFSVIDTGTHAAQVSERKNYAAYDATGFAKLWTMAHGDDGDAAPAVDFSKYYVIGVFMGQKPTGGYDISVTSVTDAGTTRTVSVTLTKPAAGCATSQAITRPYQLLTVPISDAALAHDDTTQTATCN